jgi:hypothetical protein
MEAFKKKYQNLAKELQESGGLPINAVRSKPREAEKASNVGLQNYDPGPIDFLRRCDTKEQGLEIIEYLKNRNEINGEYANKLKRQLIKDGIRSFGTKKDKDHYEKTACF